MSLFRQILIVLVASVALYGGYVAWDRYLVSDAATDGGQSRPGAGMTRVEAAPVRQQDMATTVEAVGTTRAVRSVDIVSEAEGRVERILFRAGEPVARGDVLVELDKELQEADLMEAEATLKQVETELERARQLARDNIVARSTLDELQARMAASEAAVARARRNLADRSIRAPFSGTPGLANVDVGARVTDQTIITTLDDLSSVEVEFSVPESLYALTRPGQAVEARSSAYPERVFTGRVVEVGTRIDPASRAFKVRAELPNPERALPAGMFMHVSMTLKSDSALVVPEEAIVAEAGASYVFVVENGRAHRRQVTVGRRQPGLAEVVDGLEDEAVVVVRGSARLRDGASVEVMRTHGEAAR